MTETSDWRNVPRGDFAVIAADASHSLSPVMHNAAFEAVGKPYHYRAINVPPGEVAQALDHLANMGYRGINVTMPHKEEAMGWLSEFRNVEYPEVRAVNTIRLSDRVGFNTDTHGLGRSVAQLGLSRGERCLVLGAGGSAAAAIAVLHRLGLRVSVWNRTKSRAEHLLARLSIPASLVDSADLSGFRMVMNATSAGKVGEEPPVRWSSASEDCVAYDLYYAKGGTPFLRSARSKGLVTIDGVLLLVLQGAEAWPCWQLEAEPPLQVMERVVRAHLAV
jgi:shikimate dehydrogenase